MVVTVHGLVPYLFMDALLGDLSSLCPILLLVSSIFKWHGQTKEPLVMLCPGNKLAQFGFDDACFALPTTPKQACTIAIDVHKKVHVRVFAYAFMKCCAR